MSGFLLDTNVISELRKPHPNPDVTAFIRSQAEDTLFISEVTFAEIRFGIEQIEDPERRAAIAAWLDHSLRPLFAGRTLAVDENIFLRWRLQLEHGLRRGHVFGQLNLFIAALAAENGLIVVSRDTTHFIAANVRVFDPWTATFAAGGKTYSVDTVAGPALLGRLTTLAPN